jgi:hypothetical protein
MEVDISSSRLVDDEKTWSIQLCVHLAIGAPSYLHARLTTLSVSVAISKCRQLLMVDCSCCHSVRTFAFTLIRVHRRTEERSIRLQVWGFRFRCDVKVHVRLPAEIWQLVSLSHRGNITGR